jgi:hypothetical protein
MGLLTEHRDSFDTYRLDADKPLLNLRHNGASEWGYTCAYTDAYTYAYTYADTYAYADAYTYTDAYTNADAYTDADAHTDADAYTDTYTNARCSVQHQLASHRGDNRRSNHHRPAYLPVWLQASLVIISSAFEPQG